MLDHRGSRHRAAGASRLYADVVAAAVVKRNSYRITLFVDSARVESRGKVREVPSIAAYFDRFGGARKDAKSRSTVDGKVSSRPAARGVVTGAVEGAAEGQREPRQSGWQIRVRCEGVTRLLLLLLLLLLLPLLLLHSHEPPHLGSVARTEWPNC